MSDEKKKTVTIYLRKGRNPVRQFINLMMFWLVWGGMFWANKTFLSSAIPNWALVTVAVMGLFTYAATISKTNKFDDADNAKSFVDKFFA